MFINNFVSIHIVNGLVCFIILTIFFQSKQKFIKRNGLFIKYRPEKKCFRCSGFGINRCNLCRGKGVVLYERKYLRFDPCPKCLQRRYDVCIFCRGVGERIEYRKLKYKNIFSKILQLLNINK